MLSPSAAPSTNIPFTKLSSSVIDSPTIRTDVLYTSEIILDGQMLSEVLTTRRRLLPGRVVLPMEEEDTVVEALRTELVALRGQVERLQATMASQQAVLEKLAVSRRADEAPQQPPPKE